jgi:hypothetical protein
LTDEYQNWLVYFGQGEYIFGDDSKLLAVIVNSQQFRYHLSLNRAVESHIVVSELQVEQSTITSHNISNFLELLDPLKNLPVKLRFCLLLQIFLHLDQQ